jgi:hypothetical protein
VLSVFYKQVYRNTIGLLRILYVLIVNIDRRQQRFRYADDCYQPANVQNDCTNTKKLIRSMILKGNI